MDRINNTTIHRILDNLPIIFFDCVTIFTGFSQIGAINIFAAPGHAVAKETAGSCSLCRPGRGGVRATKAEVPKRSAGEVLDSYIRVQSSEEKNAVFSSKFQQDSQC